LIEQAGRFQLEAELWEVGSAEITCGVSLGPLDGGLANLGQRVENAALMTNGDGNWQILL
jgi:hypothetical protein